MPAVHQSSAPPYPAHPGRDTDPMMPMSPAISIQERRSARPPVYPCPRKFLRWSTGSPALWSKGRSAWSLCQAPKGKRSIIGRCRYRAGIQKEGASSMLVSHPHALPTPWSNNRGPCQSYRPSLYDLPIHQKSSLKKFWKFYGFLSYQNIT